MVSMRVMQPAIDEVVDMIPVRDRFVAASRAMHMAGLMAFVAELRSAAVRIPVAHLDDMLLNNVALLMVQVPVVKIIDVIEMFDRNVPAGGAMPVGMIGVNRVAMVRHDMPFLRLWSRSVGLAGVLNGIVHEVENMCVGDRVKDRLSLPPALQKAGG